MLCSPLREGELGPHLTQCGQDRGLPTVPHAKFHLDLSNRLATVHQFLYNETLQQASRPLLSKSSERQQIWVFDHHFEEFRGGVEPWLMARWKARVDFLLTVIKLFFLSLTVDAL